VRSSTRAPEPLPRLQHATVPSAIRHEEGTPVIDLSQVGAKASTPTPSGVEATFGVCLPGINPTSGFDVQVRVIHKRDRFNPAIKTRDFPLSVVPGVPNNLWQASVTIPIVDGTHFGQPGTYLYRYQLLKKSAGSASPQIVTSWFTDPFAQSTDVGELAAVTTEGHLPTFVWEDQDWKVPDLEHLVVYELHVAEFNSTFDGIVERLDYLKSLGVTCLELMPITSPKLDFDWGYGPLHYFAPCERWGGVPGLKRLVNACHMVGIAVILDVVYEHVDAAFPYRLVYADAGLPSPMIDGDGPFGPRIDFDQAFARDFIQAANTHWLHEYHVDGFRYDQVTDLYDGAVGQKYAKMAYDVYSESLTLSRFTPSGGMTPGEYSRVIAVPEALNRPQEILRTTYSTGTWQDALLNKAESMAEFGFVDDQFVLLLDARLNGYPDTKTVHDIAGNAVDMPVAPFQYVESHDHTQLMAYADPAADVLPFTDRRRSYKLQPFAIALYTCQGTPMLWQGQELAESYVLPPSGDVRIHFRRDLHWEYFYDEFGRPLIRLHRILGTLRHALPALRSRDSFYYNTDSRPHDGVVVYRRQTSDAKQVALVYLNFSDQTQTVTVSFPQPGTYREMIDDGDRASPWEITIGAVGQREAVDVPSNYGLIFANILGSA
jgi:maltooligosyltrehalose trehalohydrolase